MERLAYLFEAKGIQSFIMSGGRLLDIAGGSELLASAVRSDGGDLLDEALRATSFEPSFSRRAGGSFMLHCAQDQQADLDRFKALWRVLFALHAPGLEFSEVTAKGARDVDARARCYAPLRATDQPSALLTILAGRANGEAGQLPVAGPFVARAPRTGLPGVSVQNQGDEADREILDLGTAKRRDSARQNGRSPGADRFIDADEADKLVWPNAMDADDLHDRAVLFPFGGREPKWIGLVHADISGLGQVFAAFGDVIVQRADDAMELSRRLSEEIEASILDAARAASRLLVDKAEPDPFGQTGADNVIPARPVLLGGDDLTIIVRGDLAVPFAEAFLEALEEKSAARLASFAEQVDLPVLARPLTACAGVVFAKAKQPFHLTLTLAESLCSYAKSKVKAGLVSDQIPPSAIAFHRLTTSFIESQFESIVRREAMANDLTLTAQPYLVGGHEGANPMPRLSDLQAMATLMGRPGFAVGPIRELKTDLFSAGGAAEKRYERWRDVTRRRDAGALDEFDAALGALVESPKAKLPFGETGRTRGATPVFDALDLRAVS